MCDFNDFDRGIDVVPYWKMLIERDSHAQQSFTQNDVNKIKNKNTQKKISREWLAKAPC